MPDFKPNHNLPAYVGSESEPRFAKTIQSPPGSTVGVQASADWFEAMGDSADKVAQDILHLNSGALHGFFQAQEQYHYNGLNEITNTRLELPQVSAHYQNQFGRTTYWVSVWPENVPGQGVSYPGIFTDLNYDGYIAWVHVDPNWPDLIGNPSGVGATSASPRPYNIYVNGYLVYQNYQPTSPSECFVILFGPTALRCESLQDKPKLNPLASKSNGALAPPVVPGPTKQIKQGTAVDGQTSVPQHDDELGYWIFNWDDPRNDLSYVPDYLSIGQEFQAWDAAALAIQIAPAANGTLLPKIKKGIQFFDARKSPLNYKGQNYAGAFLAPGKFTGEVEMLEIMYAEFYDRKKMRAVNQSWRLGPYEGAPCIIVNDSPKQWGTSTYAGAELDGQSVAFNLAPGVDSPGYDNQLVAWLSGPSNQDSNPDGAQGAAVVAALDAYNAAWDSTVGAWQTSHNQQVQSDVTALSTAQANVGATYNMLEHELLNLGEWVAFLYSESVPGFIDVTNFDWFMQQVPAWLALPGTGTLNDINLRAAQQNVITILNLYNQRQAAYDDALQALNQLEAEQPPSPPAPPSDLGQSISGFKYRTIDVAGDVWSFGPWQGG
jgi:hypothetical protein